MSRILLILAVIIAVAVAVHYGLRHSARTSPAAVSALLPREAIALLHAPDLKQTREDWHHSEVYQLYMEPAVQDFMRKPLSKMQDTASLSQPARDVEALDPKDAFLAVTSNDNDHPTIVGGFNFRGNPDEAEKIISTWRQKLLGTEAAAVPSQTLDYEKRQINVYQIVSTTICLAYADHWFLASNNLDELKAMIDRADGRMKDAQKTLGADENFKEAFSHMPASYALGFYLQPRTLAQKLATLRPSAGQTAEPKTDSLIAQIRSVCAATRFDGGKMHDVFFVGMPEQNDHAELTRNSLALASADAFFYFASLLNVPTQFALVDSSPSNVFLGDRLQRIARGLSANGITAEQWKSVFGSEIGTLADWPADSHWPSALIVFPVRDFAGAKRIASVLARLLDDDGDWVETDKNGIHYISTPYTAGFFTLRPTIAVSERFMVAGLDMGAVDAALQRAGEKSSSLGNFAPYRRAVQALPAPTNMFTYIDLGLLYTRLDAALRPMLLMSAAFVPAMNDYVDVSKLPPAEIVAKHLTPVVSSQRYDHNGYISESIGPITLSQTGLGALVIAGLGLGLQHNGWSPWTGFGTPVASPAPIPFGQGWSGKGHRFGPAQSPMPAGTP